MASSTRETQSAVGVTATNRLALFTLIAVIGFTPWLGMGLMPWGDFAFRLIGLASLAAVSLFHVQGKLEGTAWRVRAAWLAIGAAVFAVASTLASVHLGKSLEGMLNLLAILGLFLAATFFVRGLNSARLLAIAQVAVALPVAILGILQHYRPELVPADSSYPGRALGPFYQPNRFGGYIVAALPLALALTFLVHDRTLLPVRRAVAIWGWLRA